MSDSLASVLALGSNPATHRVARTKTQQQPDRLGLGLSITITAASAPCWLACLLALPASVEVSPVSASSELDLDRWVSSQALRLSSPRTRTHAMQGGAVLVIYGPRSIDGSIDGVDGMD